MMRNGSHKKALVLGIIVLFIGMSITPSSGNIMSFDDTTPPVTTHTLDPPEPDGLNGWYVSDVNVTLNATDDMSGVNHTYYNVNGVEWKIYTEPFTISEDGEGILIEYYSIDNAGNHETYKHLTIDMDQTKPDIYLIYEVDGHEPPWLFIFTANATDTSSGMERVEFYIRGELKKTVYGPGPEYIYFDLLEPPFTYIAIAFDNAGNSAWDGYRSINNFNVFNSFLLHIDITKDKTSNSNDLVEITVELCKPNGIENHKMFITKDQNEELENLFQGFKEDLNNAKTRKETVRLYSDMVVSLDEIGLLPEGSSCEEVQQLVTGEKSLSSPEKIKSNKYFNMVLERFKDKNSKQHYLKNRFCQISARTTDTLLQGPIATYFTSIIFLPILILTFFLWIILINLHFKRHFPILSTLGLGHSWEYNGYYGDTECTGWIITDGYDGKQVFEGSFFGNLPLDTLFLGYYPGITGFTGIKYNYIDPNLFYIVGKALWVKIGPDPP